MSAGTPPWTVGFAALTAIMAAVGQFFFKKGASGISTSLWSWLSNPNLLIGLALHGAGFVLLVIALRHGRLSILFPVLATSYIWGALLATRYLGEPFAPEKWAGLGLILAGVALVVRN
jgi:drug/metabolite transporter (DMT)-like permease